MGALELALLGAALLVGATGTWSPCGFSMVETIGPTGHSGGRPTTLAACATFLPGALAGALVTFGGLALVGGWLHGAGGELAYGVAAAVALAAAFAEARGARIAPQIRRQLPEHWRRVMPMPVAAALYGVLLGLGFTTFVLTFGVWALAGISLAVGEPAAGLAIALGFGVGRALPIVALAPLADRPAGRRAISLMAERPGLYRGIRLADAIALLVAAGALVLAAGTQAEVVTRVKPAADPSADGTGLVTQRGKSRAAELRDGSGVTQLPGTDPAMGGGRIAVLQGPRVVVLDRRTLAELDRIEVRRADALAVSREWLAIRTRVRGRDRIQVRALGPEGRIGAARGVDAERAPSQLGRPSLGGDRLAYAVARRSRNKLVVHRIGGGRRTVLSSPRHALSNPALRGDKLLYVRSTSKRDELRLRDLAGGRDRELRSGKARLWSTALTGKRAYVTVLTGSEPFSRVVSERR